jgi:hypothetical protein
MEILDGFMIDHAEAKKWLTISVPNAAHRSAQHHCASRATAPRSGLRSRGDCNTSVINGRRPVWKIGHLEGLSFRVCQTLTDFDRFSVYIKQKEESFIDLCVCICVCYTITILFSCQYQDS